MAQLHFPDIRDDPTIVGDDRQQRLSDVDPVAGLDGLATDTAGRRGTYLDIRQREVRIAQVRLAGSADGGGRFAIRPRERELREAVVDARTRGVPGGFRRIELLARDAARNRVDRDAATCTCTRNARRRRASPARQSADMTSPVAVDSWIDRRQ